MKTCLICPIPDLEKYVDRGATHHLLLSHLFSIPGYLAFYQRRVMEFGDYVMIDNSAKEYGEGVGLKRLLEQAIAVGAQEVVLSDVRYRFADTVVKGQKELSWLSTDEGWSLYQKAMMPRLMIVPQGADMKEWRRCLHHLLAAVDDTFYAKTSMFRPPVVGVAYHYDHLFDLGIKALLELPEVKKYTVHLLGWPRALKPLYQVSDRFTNIRSVDSSRPFVYAKSGLECTIGFPSYDARPYPSRDKHFFTAPISPSYHEIVSKNIAYFRRCASDRAGWSRCIECGSESLELRNYSQMWHDGDLHCENGHYVRMFDAG